MSDDVRRIILKAVQDASGVLDRPEVYQALMRDNDLNLLQLGLDSLTLLEVAMQIEDEAGIEMDTDILDDHPMLNDLARVLAQDIRAA